VPLDFFVQRRPHEALTYAAYMTLMENQAAAETPTDPVEAERHEYAKLNLHRSKRIARTWMPSGELISLLESITSPELWMVLTEPWCGDSAQCIPCLAVMAEEQPNIDLHLVLRDSNLDIMDQFLTEGKRAIPRLVIFDAGGKQREQWGPRPTEAQKVFDAAKAEGLDKPELLERIHLWYGRNRGQAIDAEFRDLLGRRLGAG